METDYFSPIAKAIETLLYPYAEVVLHDLATNRITAIFNSYSQRQAGDESLLDIAELKAIRGKESPEVLGPYEKINWDGRPLKSISAVLRDHRRKPIGLLCINLDVSQFQEWQRAINLFLKPQTLIAPPPVLFKDDWQERINQFVHQTIQTKGKSLKLLSRWEKHELIIQLEAEGAFQGKNAATYIGKLLGISRATVYTVLSNGSNVKSQLTRTPAKFKSTAKRGNHKK